MAELRLIANDDYEQIAHWRDDTANLDALCAIHSTARGPAIGGVRWQPYTDFDAALTDVRRLAQAMTLKSAAAGLPFGGGKAAIIGDPATKTEAQLRSFAEFVNSFEGRYYTTTDVGTTTAEIDQLSQWTDYVVGTSASQGGSGDTSELTAITVLAGIHATLEALDGDPSPAGRTIVVLGVGKVGARLASALVEAGADVHVADIRAIAAAVLAAEIGARTVSVDEALTMPCDVLSPNALGGVFSEATIPALGCQSICGAANNQLARDPADAELLAARGIRYAPDFVVNSGGVISVAQDVAGWSYEQALAHAESVYDTTRLIFERADRDGVSTAQAAHDYAQAQLQSAAAMS